MVVVDVVTVAEVVVLVETVVVDDVVTVVEVVVDVVIVVVVIDVVVEDVDVVVEDVVVVVEDVVVVVEVLKVVGVTVVVEVGWKHESHIVPTPRNVFTVVLQRFSGISKQNNDPQHAPSVSGQSSHTPF